MDVFVNRNGEGLPTRSPNHERYPRRQWLTGWVLALRRLDREPCVTIGRGAAWGPQEPSLVEHSGQFCLGSSATPRGLFRARRARLGRCRLSGCITVGRHPSRSIVSNGVASNPPPSHGNCPRNIQAMSFRVTSPHPITSLGTTVPSGPFARDLSIRQLDASIGDCEGVLIV